MHMLCANCGHELGDVPPLESEVVLFALCQGCVRSTMSPKTRSLLNELEKYADPILGQRMAHAEVDQVDDQC